MERLAVEGGRPVRDGGQKPWPRWPVWDETEERALLDTLHSGHWWSAEGAQGKAFEQEFAKFHAARHGLLCSNGTAALEIALRAGEIGYGDEVIVPAYTFVATASAVLMVGAVPIFVDSEADTLNVDAAQIAPAVTPRTRAVIVPYIAGRPADVEAVLAVARRHHLFVIEDAAQAHGAAWRGIPVGALGDMGTFSFQASKNLNAGEGGIALTNDDALANRAWSLINTGRSRDGQGSRHPHLGGNFRLGEFQAAILRAQMTRLPAQIALRQENAQYLRSLLAPIEGILLPCDDPRITSHAYHLFTFRVMSEGWGGKTAAELAAALRAEGVPCSTGYAPLYKEGVFQNLSAKHRAGQAGTRQAKPAMDYSRLCLPVCEQICRDTLWLPQTILLGAHADMDDIAAALCKIQTAWR